MNTLKGTGRERVQLEYFRYTLRPIMYSDGLRLTWTERRVYPKKYNNWTSCRREKNLLRSENPDEIYREIERLRQWAKEKYKEEKKESEEKKAEFEKDIRLRKDRLGKLYMFIGREFFYLFDVYHDLKPKETHVTKRGRDFCYRSKPKSFASFVISHLRKKGEDEKLQNIHTKAENLGLRSGALASL